MVAHPIQTTQLPGIYKKEKSPPFKWTSISLGEIAEKAYRLEASVYGIEGRQARRDLENCKWPIVSLVDEYIKNAFYLGRFKRIYVDKKKGVPFILPSQVTEIYPKATKYISPNTDVDIETTKVRKGQILLTRSGTVGVVSYVSNTLRDKSLSDDIIRIDAKQYAGYLYAYLKSSVGRLLVETNNYGAVISHIEPEHLNNIPIPDPSPILKQKIHTLIEESFRLRDESNDIIDEAQELLKESLQLPTIEKLQEKTKQFDKKAKVLNYSVPLNHLGNRFDSSYHVPIIQALEQHLQNNAKEVTAFADKRISKEIILPSHFKRIYVQEGEGTILIGGKNLYSLDPSDKKYLAPSHYNEKLKNNMLLKENMIIISAKGTPGKVVLTPSHWDGWYISSNLIKIVPSSIDIAGYIYCFLSSPYGKTLIERQIYGAVVDIIEPIHIANIKVPLLNDAVTQKIINDKALEANKKRTEAYNLEQQALSILNEQVIYAQKK